MAAFLDGGAAILFSIDRVQVLVQYQLLMKSSVGINVLNEGLETRPLDKVDLIALRHFFAVATYGGFSKAARAMGVSQPALSLGLKRLEASLGVQLIDRGSRSFVLTPAGLSVLGFCKRLEGNLESLLQNIGDGLPVARRLIRVGTAVSIGVNPVLGMLRDHPSVISKYEFEFFTMNSFQLIADLKAGFMDAALVPDEVHDDHLQFQKLGEDRVCLVLPASKRALFESAKWRESLGRFVLLTYPRETPMRTLVDRFCVMNRIRFSASLAVSNVDGVKALLAQEMGGAFVMRSLVEELIEDGILFEATLPVSPPKRGMLLVTRTDEAGKELSQMLSGLLKLTKTRLN